MSIFPRMEQRTKIILPIRSNLTTYNTLPEITEITTNTFIPSVEDGPTVVARYRNLTISNGATLTTSHRCCGLVVVVEGDLTIEATSSLSMTARGANFVPTQNHKIKNDLFPAKDIIYEIDIPATAEEIADFLKRERRRYHSLDELPAIYRPALYCRGASTPYFPDVWGEVPVVGGAGAARATTYGQIVNGSAGENRGCGGGGAGACNVGQSGAGSSGTCYSGGSGGGAVWNGTGGNGAPYGAAGGNALGTSANQCGGGAGNPGGSGSTSPTTSNGSNGTGGLLIVICTGTILNHGNIVAGGTRGGTGSANGGGGSGGGSINLFFDDIENNGTIAASGGLGGSSGATAGGAGGAGCVTLDQYNF